MRRFFLLDNMYRGASCRQVIVLYFVDDVVIRNFWKNPSPNDASYKLSTPHPVAEYASRDVTKSFFYSSKQSQLLAEQGYFVSKNTIFASFLPFSPAFSSSHGGIHTGADQVGMRN